MYFLCFEKCSINRTKLMLKLSLLIRPLDLLGASVCVTPRAKQLKPKKASKQKLVAAPLDKNVSMTHRRQSPAIHTKKTAAIRFTFAEV